MMYAYAHLSIPLYTIDDLYLLWKVVVVINKRVQLTSTTLPG